MLPRVGPILGLGCRSAILYDYDRIVKVRLSRDGNQITGLTMKFANPEIPLLVLGLTTTDFKEFDFKRNELIMGNYGD